MQEINFIIQTRKNYINLMETLSTEQLNKFPENFKNNIIWNFGHMVVTQQLLCYKLVGLEMYISDEMVEKFKKGSKLKELISSEEIQSIIEISDKNMTRFKADYEKGIFKSYTEYPTSYGIVLKSIEDAIKFNSLHESLHLGYAMAINKSL